MTIDEALGEIYKHREEKALNYCVNYAVEATRMLNGISPSSPKEFRVQLLYVLGNMTHWRGEVASQVRQTIKNYIHA